jgi:drug/metabolite transporter (DMT)-like permease
MSDGNSKRTGILLLLGVTLFWGINWPAMKVAVAEVPPFTFRTICLLAGGAALLALCRLAGLSLRIGRREIGPLVVVTLFNITFWHMLSAFGLQHMAAGRASIIAFTMPLWAALLAVPLLGEKLGPSILAGLAVGLAAMAVLVAPEWTAILADPVGPLCMLAAAVSWAIGTIALKRFRWLMPIAVLSGWQLFLGGLPVTVGALIFDGGFDPANVSLSAWLATLYAASIPIVFCHWAWFRVVTIFPAVVAAVGTLAIPVVGVLSSVVVLGEPLGLDAIAALVLVIAALVLVLIVPAWRRSAASAERA